MNTQKFQQFSDKIIKDCLLWAFPAWIKPNYLSIIRILLAPIVYYLLSNGSLEYGFIVLIFAISTDFIDGAMARTRNQITEIGKILDPIADKLLILVVLLYIGFTYWIVWVFSIFIFIEMLGIALGGILSKYIGREVGANVFGKIKMILQSLSVMLFLVGIIFKNHTIIIISEDILILALAFAFISALEQLRIKLKYIKADTNLKNLP